MRWDRLLAAGVIVSLGCFLLFGSRFLSTALMAWLDERHEVSRRAFGIIFSSVVSSTSPLFYIDRIWLLSVPGSQLVSPEQPHQEEEEVVAENTTLQHDRSLSNFALGGQQNRKVISSEVAQKREHQKPSEKNSFVHGGDTGEKLEGSGCSKDDSVFAFDFPYSMYKNVTSTGSLFIAMDVDPHHTPGSRLYVGTPLDGALKIIYICYAPSTLEGVQVGEEGMEMMWPTNKIAISRIRHLYLWNETEHKSGDNVRMIIFVYAQPARTFYIAMRALLLI